VKVCKGWLLLRRCENPSDPCGDSPYEVVDSGIARYPAGTLLVIVNGPGCLHWMDNLLVPAKAVVATIDEWPPQ